MSSDLVVYYSELVVVPRICEMCEEHPAVYWCWVMWPFTWFCRPCLDKGEHLEREAIAFRDGLT